MTYTVRVRGDSSAPIAVEYMCTACGGTFGLTVPRPAPESVPCVVCDGATQLVVSAPMTRVKSGEVIRGGSDERPPWALDTRPLADGMPVHEWRAQQTKKARADERAALRRKL